MKALRGRLGATAVAALAVLALPGDAGAKVTCQQRGVEGAGVEVSGLPAAPVAAQRYELTVTVGTADVDVIHAVPTLAVLSCPGAEHGDFSSLRATPTDDPLTFTVDVRFPKPGRYAMSVFGRDQLYDAGLHDVVTAAAAEEPASTSASAAPSSGTPGSLWIGAAAAVAAVAAASSVAVRRRRSS